MNTEAFFARLHGCLDERRDPLDDAALVAFLDAHPELLPEFALLCSGVRVLAQRARPIARKHRWPWLVAAAAAALVMLAVWPRGRPPTSTPRILAASLEELRPRAHVAANYCVRQALVATATTSFETWEYRSEPR